MKDKRIGTDVYQEALEFHSSERKGKLAIELTKSLDNQRSLSLAYSPGVAAPCLAIHKNKADSFKYTARGNFVAIVSNGTAVLGLGNLGALASKPVMEGKAALFKRFADVDAIDIEIDTEDTSEFINAVKLMSVSWGGINLEDIKAPECFIIEEELKKIVDIPVFHDDQHGTAIVVAAGLINAAHITNRKFTEMKIVVNGAGAAAIACINLVKSLGILAENIIMCDTRGVIYKGRTEGMNKWKEVHASSTEARSLSDAIKGADVFLGLSIKGALTKEMVKSMSNNPIIFAMANPDPEITPEEVKEVRDDAIIATGRSDYPNQINNLMCFPYIFRGALDVRAKVINEEMKIAAAHAIARLARKEITSEIINAYSGKHYKYGPEYIVPVPFDSRLISEVPIAVADAAIKTGVATEEVIKDFSIRKYKKDLEIKLDPCVGIMHKFFAKRILEPKTILFSSGHIPAVVYAAAQWCREGYGNAILVGKEERYMKDMLIQTEIDEVDGLSFVDPSQSDSLTKYAKHLYHKMQRRGKTLEDCRNLLLNNSSIFAASMLNDQKAEGMVAGASNPYFNTLYNISTVIDFKDGYKGLFALSILAKDGKIICIADSAVNKEPSGKMLADIAITSAAKIRQFGIEPSIAFVSYSTFGNSNERGLGSINEAISILDEKEVDFEYDGEIAANIALNKKLLSQYPFTKLSKPANILIMPSLHSAHISTKLLQEFGGANLVATILCGLKEKIQIVPGSAVASDILNAAAIAVSS